MPLQFSSARAWPSAGQSSPRHPKRENEVLEVRREGPQLQLLALTLRARQRATLPGSWELALSLAEQPC